MLFLMNDVVLDLARMKLTPRLTAHRFRALSFPSIIRMGQELYAETPLLHLERPNRAHRLAALISAKAPSITAALFVAPRADADPDEVTVRFEAHQVAIRCEARQIPLRLQVRSACLIKLGHVQREEDDPGGELGRGA